VNRSDQDTYEADLESDRILDAFEDALTMSSDQLKHLLRPSVDADEQ
jgi:hypothetical protein